MADKPKKHHKKWSTEDSSKLLIAYASGASIEVIADQMERTVVAVLHQLSKVGLIEYDKEENAYFRVRALMYQF